MEANTNVIRNEAQAPPLPWEEAPGWAERGFTWERVKDTGKIVAGFAAFLGLLGLVEYALFQMVQNWTLSGAGAAAFQIF